MQVHTQKKKRIIYFIECGLKITRVKGRQRKFEENNGPFKVLCIFKDKTLFNPELVKKRLNRDYGLNLTKEDQFEIVPINIKNVGKTNYEI